MPYATAGGYLAPPKPKRPALSTAMAAPIIGGGSDPFGLKSRRSSIDTGSLFPEGGYTPPRPQLQPAPPQDTTPMIRPGAQAAPTANTDLTAVGQSGVYDINTDPALQQVYAYTGRADQEAQAQAVADKTRLAEQYGDPTLARSLGLGDTVAQVAETNPTSILARLRHELDVTSQQLDLENTQRRSDFNEAANQQNLFFGGYRQKELARLADAFSRAAQEQTYGYQTGRADAAGQVQDALARIASALLGTQRENELLRMQEETAARGRLLDQHLTGANDAGDGSSTSVEPLPSRYEAYTPPTSAAGALTGTSSGDLLLEALSSPAARRNKYAAGRFAI